MAQYGIPYKGSKSKIAEEILQALPMGTRLVDLFGGGFAITHCAIERFSWKWNNFLYNDINPLLPPLIKKAIAGEYSYNNFTPEWISREAFFERKEQDGYIKWIWSFGNNGNDYMFGKAIEEKKRKAHEFVVFGIESDMTQGITMKEKDIHSRRLEWMQIVKSKGQRRDIEQLERLERLQQLQQLERLQQLQQLELTCSDYRNYQYREGDVVYCDIPYQDSVNLRTDYGGGFNHDDFFRWVSTMPCPIYFSSYSHGQIVWQKTVKSVMNSGSGQVSRNEVVYRLN